MATDDELQNLNVYIQRYARKVIGVKFPVLDNPQPSMTFPPDQRLYVPLSKESLEGFLSPEFVGTASPELLFSLVVGLAYHEVAHAKSGEAKVEPHILNNLICDANDFTFVPETWKGSIPFTLTLTNAFYAQAPDLVAIPLQMRKEKLSAVLHLAVCFMRKLRVKYVGKDVRSIPEDHPLHPYFERIKPISRRARRAPVKERPELVEELHEVVRDLWEEQDREEGEEDLESALKEAEDLMQSQRVTLSAKDAVGLNAGQHQRALRGILEQMKHEVEQETGGNAHSRTGTYRDIPFTLEEEIEQARYPAPVDRRIVSELRGILKPLLFERAYSRRAPSEKGQRFNPGGFYEIKTRPEAPRVKKDVLRIARGPDEVELILCFDRSGSMEDNNKTKVAVQIAVTLYSALCTIPKARVQLLAFDDVPHLIKGKAPLSIDTALRRIAHGVQANPMGGTNLPLALKECVGLTEKSPARKKVILILTDGDVSGSHDPEDLVNYARIRSIEVVCVGVQGSDPYVLEQVFGKGNAIYVDRIRRLPEEMKRVVMGRC